MNLDSRTNIFIVVILSATIILVNEVYLCLTIFFIALILMLSSNLQLKKILHRLKGLIFMILIIAVVQSLFSKEGKPLIKIENFVLMSSYGLIEAFKFLLRMFTMISLGMIVSSKKSGENILALRWYKVPYTVSIMVYVAIFYIPIFAEEFTHRLNAIYLRLDGNKIKFKNRLKIYTYIFVPTLVGVIEKSNKLAQSMDTRAFRLMKSPTSKSKLRFRVLDVFIGIVVLFVSSSAIVLNYLN